MFMDVQEDYCMEYDSCTCRRGFGFCVSRLAEALKLLSLLSMVMEERKVVIIEISKVLISDLYV